MVVFYLERSAVLDQRMLMYLRWTFDLPAVALIADTMAVGREVPHSKPRVLCVFHQDRVIALLRLIGSVIGIII